MNHNEYKKLIQLSLYGELSKNEQTVLEEHLQACEECRSELEDQRNLLSIITERKRYEVDEKLLSEARAQLRGALRMERSKLNPAYKISGWLVQILSSPPRLAFSGVAVLLVGILIGSIFFGKEDVKEVITNTQENQLALLGEDVSISNVRFIDSNPDDGQVEFTFNAVKPVYMKGSVNDPKIQSVLTYSMLNEQNPGSRLNSISAMDVKEQISYDKEIRDALITVVMTDNNPGVRREALKLLKKFPYDESVKQAYLYVLTGDSSSALRIDALNALIDGSKAGYTLSDSEMEMFKQKVQHDNNNYIRLKSASLIEEKN